MKNTASPSACGCGARGRESPREKKAVGPGGRAAGVDPALKEANLKHLRRIEGQVRGVGSMVEEDRYCADIITQIAAVRESLHAVARNLLRNHLSHCAASALRDEGPKRQEMTEELLDLVAKVAR